MFSEGGADIGRRAQLSHNCSLAVVEVARRLWVAEQGGDLAVSFVRKWPFAPHFLGAPTATLGYAPSTWHVLHSPPPVWYCTATVAGISLTLSNHVLLNPDFCKPPPPQLPLISRVPINILRNFGDSCLRQTDILFFFYILIHVMLIHHLDGQLRNLLPACLVRIIDSIYGEVPRQ